MLVSRHELRIEWGDCDAAGIVFYPRYFAIFDVCTARLLERALGMNGHELRRAHDCLGWPMVDTRARFLIPSRYDDEVTVETQATACRSSSFEVHHRLLRADGALAVEGFETRVWVKADPLVPGRIKAHPLPEPLVAALLDRPPASPSRTG